MSHAMRVALGIALGACLATLPFLHSRWGLGGDHSPKGDAHAHPAH